MTGLPPATGECDYGVCEYEYENDAPPMKRCSGCTNAFYCSAECQKRDWKAHHKENCSTLPVPLPRAKLGQVDPEVEAEFMRALKHLVAVKESWKGLVPSTVDLSGGKPAAIQRLKSYRTPAMEAFGKFTLIPQFNYTHPSFLASSTPIPANQVTLINLARLVLIYQISLLETQSDVDNLSKFFNTAQCPPSWPQYWGPKITSLPGNLSYGEYTMLPQFLNIFFHIKEG